MTTKERLRAVKLDHITVIEQAETVSTNTDARQYIAAHAPVTPVLITAESQSGGRGRQGKSFSSPKGGLYMTLITKPEAAFAQAMRGTAAASVAVCRAIERVCGLSCGVKWVNDVYVGGKKLCGILAEAVNDYEKCTTDYLIIGIGVNLIGFPEGMNATSILAETGLTVDKNELCAAITRELLTVLDSIRGGNFSCMDEYRSRSVVIGRDILLTKNGGTVSAKAVGIDDGGGLLVTYPDGSDETLSSGEITLRLADQNK